MITQRSQKYQQSYCNIDTKGCIEINFKYQELDINKIQTTQIINVSDDRRDNFIKVYVYMKSE